MLARRFFEEFYSSQMALLVDEVSHEKDGVGYFFCRLDRLWLGALRRTADGHWSLAWKSGEIPYEYDMARLQAFLASL